MVFTEVFTIVYSVVIMIDYARGCMCALLIFTPYFKKI